ncbi:carbon-nitrogen hydrolase family protein [Natronomonas sp. EA1]|uniref:carbon-nitrogen hydrolase family protein n=1 Tax=Natronomonas sp. EA1 TaxID=3421655 RepID=UPI003EBE1A89
MHTVACCQAPVDDLDPEANLARLDSRVADLPDRVEVALFPELYLTGFVGDERLDPVALGRDAPALDRVRARARANDCAILVGFAERDEDRLYNTAAYVTPEGETTYYRKRHLWGSERELLTPGTERVIVDTPLGRTGLVTCYDLNFVADSAAFTADRVDALFVIGAWPAAHATNWRLLVRARALDGVRWAVACGRTGRRELDPVTTYAGRSLVARPNGTVHSALDVAGRSLVADLQTDELSAYREEVGVFDP